MLMNVNGRSLDWLKGKLTGKPHAKSEHGWFLGSIFRWKPIHRCSSLNWFRMALTRNDNAENRCSSGPTESSTLPMLLSYEPIMVLGCAGMEKTPVPSGLGIDVPFWGFWTSPKQIFVGDEVSRIVGWCVIGTSIPTPDHPQQTYHLVHPSMTSSKLQLVIKISFLGQWSNWADGMQLSLGVSGMATGSFLIFMESCVQQPFQRGLIWSQVRTSKYSMSTCLER